MQGFSVPTSSASSEDERMVSNQMAALPTDFADAVQLQFSPLPGVMSTMRWWPIEDLMNDLLERLGPPGEIRSVSATTRQFLQATAPSKEETEKIIKRCSHEKCPKQEANAGNLCGRCRFARYCSIECQRADGLITKRYAR